MIKFALTNLASLVASRLLHHLRNHQGIPLSREEIRHAKISFSQFSEDIHLAFWTKVHNIKSGTYLDLGAFHPIHLSNTLLLYKNGWRGINVDLNPEKIAQFNALRPRDTNICCAIGVPGKSYKIANHGDPTEMLVEAEGITDNQLELLDIGTIMERTEFSPEDIDYLNIDIEGLDMVALKGSIEAGLRPRIITIEAWDATQEELISNLLEPYQYKKVGQLHWTHLYTKS